MKNSLIYKNIKLFALFITVSLLASSSFAASKEEQRAEIFNFYWSQVERCLNDFRISIPLGSDPKNLDRRYLDIASDLVFSKLDLAVSQEKIFEAEYRARDAVVNEFMGYEYLLTFKLRLPPGLPFEKNPLSAKNKDVLAFQDQYLVFKKLIDLQTTASFEQKKDARWIPNFWLGCQKELSGVTGSNN